MFADLKLKLLKKIFIKLLIFTSITAIMRKNPKFYGWKNCEKSSVQLAEIPALVPSDPLCSKLFSLMILSDIIRTPLIPKKVSRAVFLHLEFGRAS